MKKECENFVKTNYVENVSFLTLFSNQIMPVLEQSDILVAGISSANHFQLGLT